MATKRAKKEIPSEEFLRGELLAAIAAAEKPMTPAELGKLPSLGCKVTAKEVGILLAGAASVWKWGSAWWGRAPEAEARQRLLAAADERLTAAALTKRASGVEPKIASQVITTALKGLFAAKQLVANKAKIVMRVPDFLEGEIATLLAQFDLPVDAKRIRALFDASGVEPVADVMFQAMERIAFSPGTAVTFYRLRQQPELAAIPKHTFDAAALLLQANRRALLSVHDHAAALPEAERERFVTDGLGQYYVSIYSR